MDSNQRVITHEYLGKLVREMLHTLERGGVNSFTSLERRLGQSFNVTEGKIKLEYKFSELGTWTSTAYYMIPGRGRPVEIQMNQELEYSKVIVKAKKMLVGYHFCFDDSDGNKTQEKITKFRWDMVMEELKRLTNHKNA